MRAIGDFQSYKPKEKYLVYAYMMPMFVNLQEVHSKRLDGSFPENRWQFWDSWLSQAMSPLLKRIWEERREMFSEPYQQYVVEKITAHSHAPAKGSVWALHDEVGENADDPLDQDTPPDKEPCT